MAYKNIENFANDLFVDVKNWGKQIILDISNKILLFPYLQKEDFKNDLEEILSAAYHRNFVSDSPPHGEIYLERLKKYPKYIQEEVIDSLKKGNDFCGYLQKEIESFEKSFYQKY